MNAELLEITILTLRIALLATIAMLPFGIGLGYALSRWNIPGKSILESVLLLPMILPPVAVGMILMHFMSPNNAVGAAITKLTGFPLLLSWQAATIATFVVSLPLLIKASQQAFQEVPVRFEKMALTLGRSRWSVFKSVTLPLAARGILHGVMLAFARSLGEFGATSLVAGIIPGETETIALGIYARINNGQESQAWALCSISALLAFTALVVGHRFLNGPSPVRIENSR